MPALPTGYDPNVNLGGITQAPAGTTQTAAPTTDQTILSGVRSTPTGINANSLLNVNQSPTYTPQPSNTVSSGPNWGAPGPTTTSATTPPATNTGGAPPATTTPTTTPATTSTTGSSIATPTPAPVMTTAQAQQLLASGQGTPQQLQQANQIYYGTPASGTTAATQGAYGGATQNPQTNALGIPSNWSFSNTNGDLSSSYQQALAGAPSSIAKNAPTLYGNAQQLSSDPNVFNSPGYQQSLNLSGVQQQANWNNERSYMNYLNAVSNWNQNGQQGPAPTAPQYQSIDTQGFNNDWNTYTSQFTGGPGSAPMGTQLDPSKYWSGPGAPTPQSNAANAAAAPLQNGVNIPGGSGGNAGGTQAPQQFGQGPTPGSFGGGPNNGQQQTPFGGVQQFGPNQNQVPGGYFGQQPGGLQGGGGGNGFGGPGVSYPGQNYGGGGMGGFNNWGSPLEGNPFAYMTGMSNNGLGGFQFGANGQPNSFFQGTGGGPGMFSQMPLSFGGNMNPLQNSMGNMGGIASLLSMLGIA